MSSTVVANAGRLHYQIIIEGIEILPALFDLVLVPVAVRDELLHAHTPQKVKDWMAASRSWLQVEVVEQLGPVVGLHRGEAEALQLALQTGAAGGLWGDLDGRTAARKPGLVVIGTIGLLERAAEKNLIDLPVAFAKLRQTNFFAADELFAAALTRDRQRKKT